MSDGSRHAPYHLVISRSSSGNRRILSFIHRVIISSTKLRKRGRSMLKNMNAHKKEEKTVYTCPCGFCSYDLMEFLKHPFMEDVTEQNEGYSEKLEQEEK